jgi:hypothetical protein
MGRGELVLKGQTIIYNFVYQVGIGPLGYVIFAEVGSAKLRSKTVGIGIFVNSLCGMIANIVIPCVAFPHTVARFRNDLTRDLDTWSIPTKPTWAGRWGSSLEAWG